MAVVLLIILGLFALVGVVQGAKRGKNLTVAKRQGHNKCQFCGARLKKIGTAKDAFASTCSKCGRSQSWA